VEAYTRSVAVYCAQSRLNIRANAVLPAGIDTPMVREFPEKFARAKVTSLGESVQGGSGTNALGKPSDVANLVLFLASDESRFVSGQAIAVDNTVSVTMGAVPK
jgi:3(or 17)beta-hydroxysteroid dehydrogenase